MDHQKPPPPGEPLREPNATAARGNPIDRHISRQLRAIYDEVVNEPIPDRFVRLLEELERRRADRT